MEVERYTLATGETAITGSTRLWKPWWFIFIVHATPDSTTWTESRIYAATVWSLIAFGVAILGVSVLWFGYYSVRV